MSFTPINTQEEFDDAIKERLAREKKKYEGYMSPDDVQALKDTYSTSNSEELKNLKEENTSLKQQVAGFNRKELLNKVAADNKLPSSAAQFLKGETEEELNESAKALAELFPKPSNDPHTKAPEPTSPTANNQLGGEMSGVEKKFREMNPDLKL
jgi:hypothetical protein